MAFRPDDNVKHVCNNVMLQMHQQGQRVIWIYANVLQALSQSLQVAVDACMPARCETSQQTQVLSLHSNTCICAMHVLLWHNVHEGLDTCCSAPGAWTVTCC